MKKKLLSITRIPLKRKGLLMRVFCLDDTRKCPKDWIHAKGFKAAKDIILDQEDPFDVWYLDHDLGGKKSGYDFLVWAKELRPECLPKEIKVHSSNPVGAQQMVHFCQSVLEVPVTRSIFPKEE
jgi:hypothetical protein